MRIATAIVLVTCLALAGSLKDLPARQVRKAIRVPKVPLGSRVLPA